MHVAEKGVNYDESVMPRLGINDVLLASDHPFQSIIQIRRGDGYAQYGGFPFVMRSTHHISQEDHKARKNSPWPAKNDGTLVATAEMPKPTIFATVPPAAATNSSATSPIVESTKPSSPSPNTTPPPISTPNPLDELWNMQTGKRPKPPRH